MYREITLKTVHGDDKIFKFLASGATAYRYEQLFHEDLMTKLQGMEKSTDYTVGDKLAFIMNAQANGKDMKKLNYDSFIEWLEQLESSEILAHMEEIVGLYLGTKITSSVPKKE